MGHYLKEVCQPKRGTTTQAGWPWGKIIFGLALVLVSCDKKPAQPNDVAHDPLPVAVEVDYDTAHQLRGFLYKPSGTGPFPAMVFNHGSERQPSNMLGQAQFYVNQGFVLFVPHRRGHGLSASASEYFEQEWIEQGRDPKVLVQLFEEHLDDVLAAVQYVRRLPYVDSERVTVSGCSVGGIESLLAAERIDGLMAAIDFAGGSMMWASNEPLQERMKRAARHSKVPVFFIQAENDFDTAPSRVLATTMQANGRKSRLQIFPKSGSTGVASLQWTVSSLCYGQKCRKFKFNGALVG